MASGNCDACGEEPVAWMLSNTENGNTQGLGNFCLVTFAGQLAEQLGLMETPPERDRAEGENRSPGHDAGPPPQSARGRRRGAGVGSDAPPAPADAQETPEPSPANAE